MSRISEAEAREACVAAGVPDPPKLLVWAVANRPDDDKRRKLLAEVSAKQLERMRLHDTPFGRLTRQLRDMAARALRDLNDLHRDRMLRRCRDEG